MTGSPPIACPHRNPLGTGQVRMPTGVIAAVALLILGGCAGPGVGSAVRASSASGATAAAPAFAPAREVDVVSHALGGKLDRMLAALPVRSEP